MVGVIGGMTLLEGEWVVAGGGTARPAGKQEGPVPQVVIGTGVRSIQRLQQIVKVQLRSRFSQLQARKVAAIVVGLIQCRR